MVSTRRRCRLFRPWIVKPSSRVLRKLSGELTTIQYWDDRPSDRPDLRFLLGRPCLGACSEVGSAAGSAASSWDSTSSVMTALWWGAAVQGPRVREGGPSGCES